MLKPIRALAVGTLSALLIGCAIPAATLPEEVDIISLEEEEPTYEEIVADEEEWAAVPEEESLAPVVEPSPSPALTPVPEAIELTGHFTRMETSGVLWWKKVTVAGEVNNPTSTTRAGTMTVEFLKDGKVVEKRARAIPALAAGEVFLFEYKSDRAADDARLVVTTD